MKLNMNAISVDFDLSTLPKATRDILQAESLRKGVPIADLLREGAIQLATRIVVNSNPQPTTIGRKNRHVS